MASKLSFMVCFMALCAIDLARKGIIHGSSTNIDVFMLHLKEEVLEKMLLVAQGKVTSLTSGDINMYNFSWISSRVLLEQAWREMAQTLIEANFGNVKELLEVEPPKWLADSAASSCMLCGVRFHPIMCSRHHCRFCGGIFCGECSKGRSLLPSKF
ncbi:hypothetical protein LR48_Vigan511s001600 [Vigna angularis]|uniref:FYVE-type domain-containing protein n=1 Tax=Phaseolus angularis TaxID=3914 RepID=A0A0L9TCC5_PHAAN|nr:hypothetical protein LR48_Vigan511s001600 [Vigna angularis]